MPEGPNLDDLLSVWQRANDDGTSLSAEDLCASCPELLPELKRRIEVLAQLAGLAPQRHTSPATVIEPNGRGEAQPTLPINGPPGYELLGVLGRGGMGVVYKARQVGLNRVVALKMILGGAHAGDEERLRFLAEAEVVASLHHPGIVQVHDFGTHDGVPYFALEYCSGGSLDDHLAGRPLAPHVAATLIEQLAFAVQAAHDKGIVHRDLKPANVLIWDADGNRLPALKAGTVLKITDFGLARRLVDTGRGLTRPNAIMGTPSYMSPEQARSAAAAGEASDLYALGAILYELLTGRPPFLADTPQETLVQVTNHEPASVRSLQPGVPRDLETIALKCLQKDPAKRYASAKELADDLRRFLRGEPVLARPTGRAERAWRWCRRHPHIVALAGTLVGLTVAALVAIGSLYLDAARERDRARQQERVAQEERDLARDERNRAEVLLYSSLLASAQREMERGNFPLAHRYLDACRWDLRGWEHRLLYSSLLGEQVRLEGHAAGIAAVAVSPRGDQFLSAARDRTARLWCGRTGRLLHVLDHPAAVRCVAFCRTGRHAVTGAQDGGIHIWEVATGRRLASVASHKGAVTGVACAPGGWFVTAGSDAEVQAHSFPSGKVVRTFEGCVEGLASVAISPDGRWVAAGEEGGTVRVWDARTGEARHDFDAGPGLAAVAFSPDGAWIATGAGLSAKLWRADDGQPVRTLEGHRSRVTAVGFCPDGGRLVTAALDDTVRTWDAETGRPGRTIDAGAGGVGAAVWCPLARRLVSGGEDGVVRVHDPWLVSAQLNVARLPAEAAAVAWSPDGQRLAVACWDQTIRVFSREVGEAPLTLIGHSGEVVALSWSRGGLLATAARDGTVRLWDVPGRRSLHVLRHDGTVNSVAVRPDGRQVACGWSGGVKVWDAVSGDEVRDLEGHEGEATAVAYSPDGRRLATGGNDRLILMWDAESGKQMETWRGHGDAVVSLAFSPDGGRLASASTDQTVRLWDVPGRRTPRVLEGHTQPVMHVAWSPDGRRLVSAGEDGLLAFWDADTAQRLLAMAAHKQQASSAAFAPDGGVMASTGYDRTLRLWDGRGGQCRLAVQRHPAELESVRLSADGRVLEGACKDGTRVEWDAGTGRLKEGERGLAPQGVPGLEARLTPMGEVYAVCPATRERNRALERARLLGWSAGQPAWHLRRALECAEAARPFGVVYHLARAARPRTGD